MWCAKPRLVPVLLDARGTKAGQTVLVDRRLPGKEFLDRQLVALACLLEAQESAANGSDDFCLWRITQRRVLVGGRSLTYGLPSGPIIILRAV